MIRLCFFAVFLYLTAELLNAFELPLISGFLDELHQYFLAVELFVEIEYMGVPEDGYMATGEVESSVPTVRIAGTASALVGISAITVPEDRMNITGQSSDLVDIINLKEYLPSNVRLANKSFDGKITATVYIEPIDTKEDPLLFVQLKRGQRIKGSGAGG